MLNALLILLLALATPVVIGVAAGLILAIIGAAFRVYCYRFRKIPLVFASKPRRLLSKRDYYASCNRAKELLDWGKRINSESIESDKVIGDFVIDYNPATLLERIDDGAGFLSPIVETLGLLGGLKTGQLVLRMANSVYDTIPFMRTGSAFIFVEELAEGSPDRFRCKYILSARGQAGRSRKIDNVLHHNDVQVLLENVAVLHMHHERRHSGNQRVNPVDTVGRRDPLLAYIDVLRRLRNECNDSLADTDQDQLSETLGRVGYDAAKDALNDLDRTVDFGNFSHVADQARIAYLCASLLAENYINADVAKQAIANLKRIDQICRALLSDKTSRHSLGVDGRLIIRALGLEVRVQIARHYAVLNHRYASSSNQDEAIEWRDQGINYAVEVSSVVLDALDANNDIFDTPELRFLRSQVIDLYIRARRMEAFCAHCREEEADLLEGIKLYERLFDELSSNDPLVNPISSFSANDLLMRNGSVASSVGAWIAESAAMARNNFGFTLLAAGCALSSHGTHLKPREEENELVLDFKMSPRGYIDEAMRQFQLALDGTESDPTAEGRNARTYSHSNRGYARAIIGDYEGALVDNQKAIDNHIANSIDNYYFEGHVERALICSLAANSLHGQGRCDQAQLKLTQVLDQNKCDLKTRRICNQAKKCVDRAVAARAIDSSIATALYEQIKSARPNGDADDADERPQQRADAVRVLFHVLEAIGSPSTPNGG